MSFALVKNLAFPSTKQEVQGVAFQPRHPPFDFEDKRAAGTQPYLLIQAMC